MITELHNVEIKKTFKIADIEFIKFTDRDGKVAAVAKNPAFYSKFGSNADYGKSDVKERLEKEFLPKIIEAIGEENVLEFETDLTAFDGTHPFANVRSKISLPTLDFYREHREIFGEYNPETIWWLVTPDSEKYSDFLLCVTPVGIVNVNISDFYDFGVRPILIFSSSISVSCD